MNMSGMVGIRIICSGILHNIIKFKMVHFGKSAIQTLLLLQYQWFVAMDTESS